MTDTTNWPALSVELTSIDSLRPFDRNAKKHPDEQLAKIEQSIREFGWTTPIIATDDGTVRAGHGRLIAAERMGLTEVPVAIVEHWTDAQARAYTLADNRIAESAWDDEMLKLEIGELADLEYDLELTGFDDDEIDRFLADDEEKPKAGPPVAGETSRCPTCGAMRGAVEE